MDMVRVKDEGYIKVQGLLPVVVKSFRGPYSRVLNLTLVVALWTLSGNRSHKLTPRKYGLF